MAATTTALRPFGRALVGRHIRRQAAAVPRRFQSTTTSSTTANSTANAAATTAEATAGASKTASSSSASTPSGTAAAAAGPLARLGNVYTGLRERRPYLTQIIFSLIIYAGGDLGSQYMAKSGVSVPDPAATEEGEVVVHDQPEGQGWYDPKRSLRAMTIGGIAAVPVFNWFMWLSHNFNYSSKLLSVVTKVAVNQLGFTPVINSYFFGMQSLLSGDSLSAAWDRIRATVPTSWVNSLKFWPAIMAFNFTFVPIDYRSIIAGSAAVGWQTYLSFLNRRAEDARLLAEAEAKEAAEAVAAGAAAGAQAVPA